MCKTSQNLEIDTQSGTLFSIGLGKSLADYFFLDNSVSSG
jgi:hypothetical protein